MADLVSTNYKRINEGDFVNLYSDYRNKIIYRLEATFNSFGNLTPEQINLEVHRIVMAQLFGTSVVFDQTGDGIIINL